MNELVINLVPHVFLSINSKGFVASVHYSQLKAIRQERRSYLSSNHMATNAWEESTLMN